MNDHRIQYKDFIIVACPQQLADSNRWNTAVTIELHTGPEVINKPFSAGNTYETRDEALEGCFNFGRQIIDEQIPGCTVRDF